MISKLQVALFPSEGKSQVLLLPSLQVAQLENTMEEEYSLLFNRPNFNILDRTLEDKDSIEK